VGQLEMIDEDDQQLAQHIFAYFQQTVTTASGRTYHISSCPSACFNFSLHSDKSSFQDMLTVIAYLLQSQVAMFTLSFRKN
jgi:hypothetical protein